MNFKMVEISQHLYHADPPALKGVHPSSHATNSLEIRDSLLYAITAHNMPLCGVIVHVTLNINHRLCLILRLSFINNGGLG